MNSPRNRSAAMSIKVMRRHARGTSVIASRRALVELRQEGSGARYGTRSLTPTSRQMRRRAEVNATCSDACVRS